MQSVAAQLAARRSSRVNPAAAIFLPPEAFWIVFLPVFIHENRLAALFQHHRSDFFVFFVFPTFIKDESEGRVIYHFRLLDSGKTFVLVANSNSADKAKSTITFENKDTFEVLSLLKTDLVSNRRDTVAHVRIKTQAINITLQQHEERASGRTESRNGVPFRLYRGGAPVCDAAVQG